MDFRLLPVVISRSLMKQLEVISFDAEGTLVTTEFSEAIWHEAIPALYARTNALDLASAKRRVYQEYDAVGNQRLEWYDIEYWFDYLKLGSSQPVIHNCLHKVARYPEVDDVLSSLADRYTLVVASGTPLELLDFLLADVKSRFARVFSSISHFRQLKTPDFYLKLCAELGVSPGQVLHVGDSRQFDLCNARESGLHACYLDRSRRDHEESLGDLTELERVLSGFD
jgi:HAD superfamily hydrolase (TIGR01549 family)